MDRFAALADPHRRKMLEMLAPGPLAAGALASEFALSAPAVSQHLRALRQAGLVKVEAEGTRRIYSLDLEGLAEVATWIHSVRGFWSSRLDRLEAALLDEKGET